MTSPTIDAIIDDYTGRSRLAMEYGITTRDIVKGPAKQPGFSAADWAPLAALVDTDVFERVGNFKEVMNWTEYVDFLTSWASSADWDCSFKRVTEHQDIVFLELEERSAVGDFKSVVNSVSVYEFDEGNKIRHIDVYLQMALPESAMLEGYDGVDIGG